MGKYVLMQKSGKIFIEKPVKLPITRSSYEVGTLESSLNPWELRAGIADRYIKELKVKERMLNKIYDFVCEAYDTSDEDFIERYGEEDV